jgi:hypothetical protein
MKYTSRKNSAGYYYIVDIKGKVIATVRPSERKSLLSHLNRK